MKISLLGSGAFATALAKILLENNHEVSIYGIDPEELSDLQKGINKKYFGKQKLPKIPFLVTNHLEKVLLNPDFIILATPSYANQEILSLIKTKTNKSFNFVNIAKGFYPQSCDLLSDLLIKQFPKTIHSYAALIGPSYAQEIFNNKLTMINVFSDDQKLCKLVIKAFDNDNFKVFSHPSLRQGEYYANLKNIYALAGGITEALYNSYNTLTSVLTFAFAEIDHFIKKEFNDNKTYAQLAAFGDFVLSTTNRKSRNFTFGLKIALEGINQCRRKYGNITTEGYVSLKSFYSKVINDLNNYPLLQSLYEICYENKKPQHLLDFLGISIKE